MEAEAFRAGQDLAPDPGAEADDVVLVQRVSLAVGFDGAGALQWIDFLLAECPGRLANI